MSATPHIEVNHLGSGCTLTGWFDAGQGIADAVAAGHVFCMPKLPDGWLLPAGYMEATCPVCEARMMRSDRIPADARVACTTCALKAGISARSADR